jgi:hypothetical protein
MGKPTRCGALLATTNADWLLFTDADIMFRKTPARADGVRGSGTRGSPGGLATGGHASFSEKMMIAFFQLLFVFAHGRGRFRTEIEGPHGGGRVQHGSSQGLRRAWERLSACGWKF